MVIPRPRRSRRSPVSGRIGPTATAPWRSIRVAQASPSAPTRTVFLLHGEDPFRTRLRLGELVGALLGGESTASGGLGTLPEPRLGALLGVARLDARSDPASAIALAGQSQGLFDAVDERRVVIVEHAEALREMDVVLGFPREAALVLVSVERLAAGRGRRGARARPAPAQPTSLVDAVDTAGGAVERIERLFPVEVGLWIEARARLHGIAMGPDAGATALARRITRVDILRAYEAIYATDQVIKTGRAESDGAALMLCVLDLCGVAGADLRDMLLVEPPRRL